MIFGGFCCFFVGFSLLVVVFFGSRILLYIPEGEYFFNEVGTLTPIVLGVSHTSFEIKKMFLRCHVDQIDDVHGVQSVDD